MSAEGIIIKHFMISLEYTYSVHASTVHHNFWTSQVVWTCRCQVKSSESDVLKSTAVNLGSF